MRIGMFGGTVNEGTIDDVVAEARQAEADGFASYWAPNIFGHDALTALAIVGREVPRIELGTSVVPTYPRHPSAIAQQCLTVSAACEGRLTLGIGLSHKIVIENMLGMSYDKPVRHIRDYLSILGPLSRNEPASHQGEAYSTHMAINAKGAPPFGIVVAALGPQMLKATAELADGTITWCTGPKTLESHVIPTITEAADAAGRPAPRVVVGLPVCVTDDVDGARERAAKIFEIYGSLPSYRAMLDREGVAGPEGIAIVGTEAEVVGRIGALGDIGVTEFAASEFSANPDEAAATRCCHQEGNVVSWVQSELDDRGVATIVVDHPPINLITIEVLIETATAIAEAATNDAVRVVVSRSANPEWFLAHFDVEAIQALPRDGAAPTELGPYDQMCETLRTMPKATIAVVAGRVGGGGSELALACDMRFATPDAIFIQPEVAVGILPGAGGTVRLPRLIGRSRALEVVLGCDDVDAATAERWGLVNRVLPADELDAFVDRLAGRIAGFAPHAVAAAKASVLLAETGVGADLLAETAAFNATLSSDETQDRMQRFLDAGGQTPDGERRLGQLAGEL